MKGHNIAPYGEWFEAHRAHVDKEKAFTRQREQLAADRRALPWLRIDEAYEFDTTEGRKSLADLFADRSQLIIYHFMFPPNATYRCIGCSFLSDHIDAANQHLKHHDVSLIVCSRAPLAELLAYKARMGWQFDWVSSFGSDFNFDFQVSFTEEQIASGKVLFQFRRAPHDRDGSRRRERLLQGRGREGLLHLPGAGTGRRESDRHLWLSGPDPARPQRKRTVTYSRRLGAAPQRV